jgi:hypothetical protein
VTPVVGIGTGLPRLLKTRALGCMTNEFASEPAAILLTIAHCIRAHRPQSQQTSFKNCSYSIQTP